MRQELDALTNTLKKGVKAPIGKIDFVVSPEISGRKRQDLCFRQKTDKK